MTSSRLASMLWLLLVPFSTVVGQTQSVDFSWDNATVYRVLTDRFSSGDKDNNTAYGRGLDGSGSSYDVDSLGHFLGGDFVGLTGWLDDGYFDDLGVNVLWLSSPVEQVQGWVGGGSGEYQKYGFDGTLPLDFTELDKALGTKEEFKTLVDSAHRKGMRVIIDVQLNHVGYATLNDMSSFGFGSISSEDWRSWRPSSKTGWQSYNDRFIVRNDSAQAWAKWWGPNWIRANLPGYTSCGETENSGCLDVLPDLRDDVEANQIPSFLELKWGADKLASEKQALDAYFSATGYQRTGANHVVKWLSDLVREFGIDGFVVHQSKYVSSDLVKRLKEQASQAYAKWNASQAGDASASASATFLFYAADQAVSDVSLGFDATGNVISKDVFANQLDSFFTEKANALKKSSPVRQFSTVSSLESGIYTNADKADILTKLLLTPGNVVLLYGDESGRKPLKNAPDVVSSSTSFMNWADFDENLFEHIKKVGAFRKAHPAISAGGHDQIQEAPYAFYRGVRVGMGEDEVVVVMGASGKTRLNVSIVWPDDTVLRDAYTGNVAIVSFGQVTFTAAPSGILLLEEVK